MKCNAWWIFILFIVILVIWLAFFYSNDDVEGFGDVMGSLGKYQKPLAHCIRECDREDPTKSLAHTNLACDEYCQSTFTDKAKYGIPPPQIRDKCEEQCSVGPYANNLESKYRCMSQCQCHEDTKETCRQHCAYSTLDSKECLKSCMMREIPKCNSVSWVWKRG